MLKRQDIRIRDPFVLTDNENGCYYMYGTTSLRESSLGARPSFSVYKTFDLENFCDPVIVFDGKKSNFWADFDYWAPEVHKYNGKYYMFASFKSNDRHRATSILVCDTPDGEFSPISNETATPSDWECLDGTFLLENGKPYIVFSREWTEVKDGQIWACELSEDLSNRVGTPFLLFSASENKSVTELEEGSGIYVTDGPFFYKENGMLKLIWSSFCNGKYSVLAAQSDCLFGKWEHMGDTFDFDGGHAMIFTTLEGKRMISLHSPNTANLERAVFYEF